MSEKPRFYRAIAGDGEKLVTCTAVDSQTAVASTGSATDCEIDVTIVRVVGEERPLELLFSRVLSEFTWKPRELVTEKFSKLVAGKLMEWFIYVLCVIVA